MRGGATQDSPPYSANCADLTVAAHRVRVRTRLSCHAPAFEGKAEVFAAVWTENGAIIPKATALTIDGKPGRSYTCALRARNEGGSSRSAASAPVRV